MPRLAGLRLRERWSGWEREPFSAASTRHVGVYERASSRAGACALSPSTAPRTSAPPASWTAVIVSPKAA
jgi:hypothetical protein